MVASFRVPLVIFCAALMALRSTADGGPGPWENAHATFYGNITGEATMDGACGYENMFNQGYGLATTCVSEPMFVKGTICGACFEVQCHGSSQCTNNTIKVTVTNYCSPDCDIVPPKGGQCAAPHVHFDLSEVMYLKIAKANNSGSIPVQYRRVSCTKTGGIRFETKGGIYWIVVLVYNVGGAGDVRAVSVKGSNTEWIDMTRSWGQRWQTNESALVGQSLSFRVTTSDGRTVESPDCAPADWTFNQVYEGNQF